MDKIMTLRVDSKDKAKLDRIARQNERTTAAEIRLAIRDYLKKQGTHRRAA